MCIRDRISLAQETVITARAQELDLQINRMLLAAEAKRRGLIPSVLIVLEVKARVAPPTEAEARAFYEQNKKRIGRSFSSVKNDILTQLRSERENVRGYHSQTLCERVHKSVCRTCKSHHRQTRRNYLACL